MFINLVGQSADNIANNRIYNTDLYLNIVQLEISRDIYKDVVVKWNKQIPPKPH